MNSTTRPADKSIPADQPLTTEELDALDALAPATFPGPWRYERGNRSAWDNALPILDVVYNGDEIGPFAAAAREAMPRLIAEIRRLHRIVNNVAVDLNDEDYPLGHRIERASSHLLECPEAVFGEFPHGPGAQRSAAGQEAGA